MTDNGRHSTLITEDNPALAGLSLSWKRAEFTAEDGLGPLGSLHEAGDAMVAVARMDAEGITILGSGVMVAPGILLTATHVFDEFPREGSGPVFLTFLPNGARAWLPKDVATVSKASNFDESRKVVSDLSLVSCTLNSAAQGEVPLHLAPMQIALPLVGERLWAIGFRHQGISDSAAVVTPMVSSGLVTAAFPLGRGERMSSPCFEVAMDTLGGMSGGAVVNSAGYLVGIVSSSFAGGPSYITLIWDAIRLRVKGTIPKLRRSETVSLLGADALGVAKLKGKVNRDPWGDVTFRLNEEEGKLFGDSIPPTERKSLKERGLSDDQLEEFVDQWGAEMERLGNEAAIAVLENLPVRRMRDFLEVNGAPAKCLEGIDGFSVEDFEGVEDFSVKTTSSLADGRLNIEFYFDLSLLVWRVRVQEEVYRQRESEYDEYFFNPEIESGVVTMEAYQHCYFKGTVVFDPQQEEFSEVAITSCAIKRPRPASPKD